MSIKETLIEVGESSSNTDKQFADTTAYNAAGMILNGEVKLETHTPQPQALIGDPESSVNACGNQDALTATATLEIENNGPELPSELSKYKLDPDYIGTPEQVEKVVKDLQPIIRTIAKRFWGVSSSIEDFIQAGNEGLLIAITRFDENMGYSFSSYALSYVFGYMQKLIRDYDRPIKETRKDGNKKFVDYIVAKEELEQSGKTVTPGLIAEATSLSKEEVKKIEAKIKASKPTVESFNNLQSDEERNLELSNPDFSDNLIDKLAIIGEVDEVLDRKSAIIVKAKLGIPPFDRIYTQSEIGALVHLSQMQVSRKYRNAIDKMRNHLIKTGTLDA